MAMRKVVVQKSEFVGGAPMEAQRGVRDWKVIYPETGVATKTLIMGIVQIPPGQHSPLHRHNCEEVYYVLAGRGEIESDGERYPFEPGDAIYNRENSTHRVFNTGEVEPVRLLVVAGIMFVGLLPQWPTPSPYEILETA
jgi:mannose-6-phosphate isomerase-like protein (cupin superfamily)